jgi:hypothetical protein
MYSQICAKKKRAFFSTNPEEENCMPERGSLWNGAFSRALCYAWACSI